MPMNGDGNPRFRRKHVWLALFIVFGSAILATTSWLGLPILEAYRLGKDIEWSQKFSPEKWRDAAKDFKDYAMTMNELPCGRNTMIRDLLDVHLPKLKTEDEIERLLGPQYLRPDSEERRRSEIGNCMVYFVGPPCGTSPLGVHYWRFDCPETGYDSLPPNHWLFICPDTRGNMRAELRCTII